jgi:hypothetical protein
MKIIKLTESVSESLCRNWWRFPDLEIDFFFFLSIDGELVKIGIFPLWDNCVSLIDIIYRQTFYRLCKTKLNDKMLYEKTQNKWTNEAVSHLSLHCLPEPESLTMFIHAVWVGSIKLCLAMVVILDLWSNQKNRHLQWPFFFLVFSIRKVGWFLITSWIDVSRLTTLEGQNVRRALVKHPTHKLRSRNDTLGKYWLLHKKIIKKRHFFL